MILNVETAISLLDPLMKLGMKIAEIIATGKPANVEDEMIALDKARMPKSEDVIAQADGILPRAIDLQK